MVKDWMSSAPITIDLKASLSEALATMEKHHVSLLPVLENDKLSGIITDMDMKPSKTLCCSNSAAGGFALILDRVLYKIDHRENTREVYGAVRTDLNCSSARYRLI